MAVGGGPEAAFSGPGADTTATSPLEPVKS